MEFNSQICTTREQSERLLALGLKKETADMKLWIARDKNGELWLYDAKPIKDEIFFDVETFAMRVELKPTLFPEVTFENSPQEFELKSVDKI